jgi:hypothetical protein
MNTRCPCWHFWNPWSGVIGAFILTLLAIDIALLFYNICF